MSIKGLPGSYTVIIDDTQREMFIRALGMLNLKIDLSDEDRQNVQEMREMLIDLPEEEMKDPGIHHGLCL